MVRTLRRVHVEGLKELDKALGELPKATARNVLKRTLLKAGQPLVARATALAPVDTGELAASIIASARIKNTAGNFAYWAAMKAGAGKDVAVQALRDARRSAGGTKTFAEVAIGPTEAKTKKDAIKRIVQEFGSVNQPAQPYLRPAWDAEQDNSLNIIKQELGDEIMKAAARVAKRQARLAAKLAGT